MYSKYDITTARYGDVKDKHYHLAILPWGSTEPHNLHLPYCTDMLHAQAVAFEAAEKAAKNGVNAMVLPGIPLGSQNPGQIELPFCIHASQRTQIAVLEDIVESLRKQGISKLLIMNGHGGNNFKGMIRDIVIKYPDFQITVLAWFSILPLKDFFEEKIDDHAGEQETCVMLHYYPELVNLAQAGDGGKKIHRGRHGENREIRHRFRPERFFILTSSSRVSTSEIVSWSSGLDGYWSRNPHISPQTQLLNPD